MQRQTSFLTCFTILLYLNHSGFCKYYHVSYIWTYLTSLHITRHKHKLKRRTETLWKEEKAGSSELWENIRWTLMPRVSYWLLQYCKRETFWCRMKTTRPTSGLNGLDYMSFTEDIVEKLAEKQLVIIYSL